MFIVGQKDVGRLEIGVDDVVVVGIREAQAQPPDNGQRLRSWQPIGVGGDYLIQRIAIEGFHCQVDELAVAIEIVNRGDVWVGEGLGFAGFPLERHDHLCVPLKLVFQDLEGNVRIAVLSLLHTEVFGPIDHTHSAFAYYRFQDEAVFDDGAETHRIRVLSPIARR